MDRRQKLQDLIDRLFDGNQAAFARAIKKKPAQINHWLTGHRMLGDAGARHIELSLRLEPGYFGGEFSGTMSATESGSDGFSATGTVTLTPRQQALLGLFEGLTEGQQDEEIRRLEAQKQSNEAIVSELMKKRQA